MVGRLVSALLALAAAGLVVDLFFYWTESGELDFRTTGLDSSPGFFCFATGVPLVFWELLGAFGVVRTRRSDSLVSFFLAAGTAIAAIASVVHLKWGGARGPLEADLAIPAFLAIPLSILVLAGAVAHLGLYVIASRRDTAR